ncbi:MAG: polysaccharide biosynthesis/export family protein [Novosphingobium sp.]
MRMITAGVTAMLLASAGMPGIAAAQVGGPPADASTNMQSYILGQRDIIGVEVAGRADYKTQVQVQEDGTVALPLIGLVPAASLTVPQLRAEIQRRLTSGGFFLKPDVIVTLITASSQYAVMLGDVGQSGLLMLDREYRLTEVLARAGGVRPGSDDVTVTSPTGETREYSMRAIATNKAPDPIVVAGSKVLVAPAKVFYIYGQIGSPGGFPVDEGMTIRQALARAGGITSLGSSKKVKLYRGEQVTKRVKLNTTVQPGDTIVVGERFF